MGSKVWLMFLLLALAMVAESTKFDEASWGTLAHLGGNDDKDSCNGGHCNVEDVTESTLMDSETNIRQLAQRRKYISYGALRANSIPCNRRGHSYYNCQKMRRANPYTRGCSVITHCYRFTH